ncbi:MAG TPA: NAD-dependent epimerase/dehydratase family protein [Longimicrobiales bacterium]
MTTNRRDFLRTTAAAGGALGLGLAPGTPAAGEVARQSPAASGQERPRVAPRPIRVLFLGGTGFIGPFQVRYALERGHEVTLFNRGQTNADLFPGVEKLVGDRNDDLRALEGRTWDVVIDNSTANPDWVAKSAELLKDSVGLYFYTSSRSAYADTSRVPMTADAPTATYESEGVERGAERLPYGLAKAESERAALAALPGRTTIFRPGLIIGPQDETDRFTYWPARIHRGGEILAPGDGTDPVQIIDVRDFTEWMIRMAEDGRAGIYNVVGPATPRPMAELLYGIRAVTTAEATFTWVPREFLMERRVRPYQEMPVWRPPVAGSEGFARFDLTPEVEAGLTFRPLAMTARDTLEYHFSRPPERQANLRAGLSAEREAEVLAEWHMAAG